MKKHLTTVTLFFIMAALFLAGVSAPMSQAAAPANWQDSPALDKLFKTADLTGTFVLYDVTNQSLIGHNRARAEKRFIPASTFKIPNTLMGLATGAVKTVDDILPYGGQKQPFASWEHDMSLREAVKISNVPVYKELARRIGLERMGREIAKLNYGNGEIGDTVDNFWLKGPLEINALEQTDFLGRLALDKLPFPLETQAAVKEIFIIDQGPGWVLYAKTGTTGIYSPNIGWWVGWVRKGDKVYSFALNLDISETSDTAQRIEFGRACLKALDII